MAMKNPPHPGPGIRDDIDALGLSIAEAAQGMGITRQQLYNLINGKSGITPEMAVRLEKAVGSWPIIGCASRRRMISQASARAILGSIASWPRRVELS